MNVPIQLSFVSLTNQILDFNKPKISKNYVVNSLRKSDFTTYLTDYDSNSVIFLEHVVKVGMFEIQLILTPTCRSSNLRDYGKFFVKIFELKPLGRREILLIADERFSAQPWSLKNFNKWIRIKDLVDIILYCHKLNKLKMFS